MPFYIDLPLINNGMRRIAVTICFALTLLCPVFCLANASDECSEHSQPMSENCEAMTFGAVVEKVQLTTNHSHSMPSPNPTPDAIPEPSGPTIPDPHKPELPPPSPGPDFPEIPKPGKPISPYPSHPEPSPTPAPPANPPHFSQMLTHKLFPRQ